MKYVATNGAKIISSITNTGSAAMAKGSEVAKDAATYALDKAPEVATVAKSTGLEIASKASEAGSVVAGVSKDAVIYAIDKAPEVVTLAKDAGVAISNKATELVNMVPPEAVQVIKDGAVFAAVAGGSGVGAPAVLSAEGFGSGGIAAGSSAAKLMSVAWKTKVGMGAVSLAQSVGAAGITGSTAVASGAVATGVYEAVKVMGKL